MQIARFFIETQEEPVMKALILSTIALAAFGCAQLSDKQGAASAAKSPPGLQMQAVLSKLQALGVKPVEKLTPAQARSQPTPADAVKAVLTEQGKSTAPMAVGKVENR